MEATVQQGVDLIIGYGLRILGAILIFIIGRGMGSESGRQGLEKIE